MRDPGHELVGEDIVYGLVIPLGGVQIRENPGGAGVPTVTGEGGKGDGDGHPAAGLREGVGAVPVVGHRKGGAVPLGDCHLFHLVALVGDGGNGYGVAPFGPGGRDGEGTVYRLCQNRGIPGGAGGGGPAHRDGAGGGGLPCPGGDGGGSRPDRGDQTGLVHHGNRLVAGGPSDARLGGIRRENRGLKGCGAACGEGERALIQDYLFHRDGGDGDDLHIGVLEDAGGQVVSVNLAGAAGLCAGCHLITVCIG